MSVNAVGGRSTTFGPARFATMDTPRPSSSDRGMHVEHYEDRDSRLRALRHRLDNYGADAASRETTWDDLLDAYDAVLAEAARERGLAVPDPPSRLQRRFTRGAREALERELARAGHDVRRG